MDYGPKISRFRDLLIFLSLANSEGWCYTLLMTKQALILMDVKKRAKPKRQGRLQSFLEGIGYMMGAAPIVPSFPEAKPAEKMIREAWENTGRHMFDAMDSVAEEHHLARQ